MSRTILWVVLLPLALGFPLSASAAVDPAPYSAHEPSANKSVRSLLNDAQSAMRDGRVRDALRALNIAHNLEPNNPYILARLAVALNMSGDFDSALDRLHRAQKMGAPSDVTLAPLLDSMLSLGENQNVLDLFPDPAPASRSYAAGIILRARASALQVIGDSAGATAAMNRSLAILADFDGLMTAARIALMQGQLDASAAYAEQALKLKPRDIEATMLQVDLAMQKQQQVKAVALAEQLVAGNPRSVSALLTRIKVYLSVGRTDEASADVDRILAEKQDMLMARYFRSVIVARQGNAKAAWGIAQSLPKEYLQTSPGIALNVANMAVAAGFLESGAAILNVVVIRFPYLLDARLQLADIRLRQKSPEHAINALALVQDSKDPRVEVAFARIALMKHDSRTAQTYIQRVIASGSGEELGALDKDVALKSLGDYLARHPDNRLVKKQYALALLGFGELPKAAALYEQLVRGDPADGFSRNNLAWLVVKDNPARALTLAQGAVKAAPESPDFLDTLGSMQMNQKDPKGAMVSLRKAQSLRPDDPEISYHLALALEAGGEPAQSQAILLVLVKRGGFRDMDAARDLLTSKLKRASQTQQGVR